MCGITAVWLNSKKNRPAQKVISILKNQQQFGRSSTGISWLDGKQVRVLKDTGSPDKFADKYRNKLNDITSNKFIGHNRMPSVGEVTSPNAHPFLSAIKDFALVHQGTVNRIDLKHCLITHHTFQGTTDSEVIMHLMEELVSETKDYLSAMKVLRHMVNHTTVIILTSTNKIIGFGDWVMIRDTEGVYVASSQDSFCQLFGNRRKVMYMPQHNHTIFEITDNELRFHGSVKRQRKHIAAKQPHISASQCWYRPIVKKMGWYYER